MSTIAEKLTTIAENQTKVFEAGRQKEYDDFWDSYQQNGERGISYSGAFAGTKWTYETFKPKYDIIPSSAQNLFWNSKIGGDLVEHLENLGVKLDFSIAYSVTAAFAYSEFTRIGEICVNLDAGQQWVASGVFSSALNLTTIDKIIVGSNWSFDNAFNNCYELENVIFEGELAKNGLNLQWSTKLSKASWQSIINALSSTTSGLSISGSLASVNKAFETSEGANDGSTSEEWEALINTKTNWTVTLVE